jgi:hypothetical protein
MTTPASAALYGDLRLIDIGMELFVGIHLPMVKQSNHVQA